MTRPEECSVIQDVLKLLANDGFDGLGEAIRRIINEAMRLERQNHLGIGPYERSDERRGYANGYKPKTVQCRHFTRSLRLVACSGSSPPAWGTCFVMIHKRLAKRFIPTRVGNVPMR